MYQTTQSNNDHNPGHPSGLQKHTSDHKKTLTTFPEVTLALTSLEIQHTGTWNPIITTSSGHPPKRCWTLATAVSLGSRWLLVVTMGCGTPEEDVDAGVNRLCLPGQMGTDGPIIF